MDFSQEYFLPHNKIINNVGYFYCPSTQIQKDDIAEIPVHVLALSKDPSKRNFGKFKKFLTDKFKKI